MSRPNAFVTMTAGVALVFCLACLTGDRMGVSQAHAQPAGTPDPAGTPIPFGDPGIGEDSPPSPPPCTPPPSFTLINNDSSNEKDIIYTCGGTVTTIDTIAPNETIIFKTTGHCSDCDNDCRCIQCQLTELFVNGSKVSLCDAQQAYMSAYGLDLFAEPLILTESSDPQYDQYDRRIPRWAVPVLNDQRQLIGWEFTEIEPEFSVENGEVVIRARRTQSVIENGQIIPIVEKGDIIGGPHGVTIDDE